MFAIGRSYFLSKKTLKTTGVIPLSLSFFLFFFLYNIIFNFIIIFLVRWICCRIFNNEIVFVFFYFIKLLIKFDFLIFFIQNIISLNSFDEKKRDPSSGLTASHKGISELLLGSVVFEGSIILFSFLPLYKT